MELGCQVCPLLRRNQHSLFDLVVSSCCSASRTLIEMLIKKLVHSWFRLPETMDRSFADLESLFQQGISARKFKHTKVEREHHVSPSHQIVSAVLIDFASLPQSSTRWWMPPLWTRRSSMRITSNTPEREGILETPMLPSCLLWGLSCVECRMFFGE
jgi:hypothetical protein